MADPQHDIPPSTVDDGARAARLARRLARFRLWLMIGTGLIVVAAFVLVLSVRAPLPAPEAAPARDTAGGPVPEAAVRAPAALPAPGPTPAGSARAALERIAAVAAESGQRWQRARLLLDASQMRDSTRFAEYVDDAQRALALGESTAAAVGALGAETVALAEAVRSSATGSGFRLKAAAAAGSAYVAGLGDDARLQAGYLQAMVASLEALAAGDDAETEIKANVANGYLRQSELKQRSLARQREALATAMRGLGNATE